MVCEPDCIGASSDSSDVEIDVYGDSEGDAFCGEYGGDGDCDDFEEGDASADGSDHASDICVDVNDLSGETDAAQNRATFVRLFDKAVSAAGILADLRPRP